MWSGRSHSLGHLEAKNSQCHILMQTYPEGLFLEELVITKTKIEHYQSHFTNGELRHHEMKVQILLLELVLSATYIGFRYLSY